MLTARDIEEYPLEKSLGGYKTESVDSFLDKVAADYQKLADDNAALSKKITVLVESINKYRQDEDYIKSTLIESQKLASATVAKANEDAEAIMSEANTKAEETVSEANATAKATLEKAEADSAAMIAAAESKVATLEEHFNKLQAEVDSFRSQLLATYKVHIEAISELPVFEAPAEEIEEEVEEIEEEVTVLEEEDIEEVSAEDIEIPSEDEVIAGAIAEALEEIDDEELLEELEASELEEIEE